MIKLFLDLDGTLAKFNVRNALDRFDKEEGFFLKLKPYKNIGIIDKLARNGNVYIISASPNIRADLDKLAWIQDNIPNMPYQNIVLCRVGDNKAQAIEKKLGITITNECYLLDDYTKNLVEWENANGKGIKRLTTVADNSTKKWKGLEIKDLLELSSIVA